jgi:hypothetical protein
MSIDTTTSASRLDSTDSATRHRVALLAIVIAVTAVVAVPAGVLWPEPAGGGNTYTYADIEPIRNLWWGLLMVLSVLQVLNVPTQALAGLLLVRRRGATWATLGAALMWLGAGMQGAGVAAWAGAYFFPTDPGVDAATGAAVIDQANQDSIHLFAVMIPGALLVVVGTALLSVGLLRSHAVPKWVPILALATVLTFVIPGNGLAGLITSVPMAAAAIGLGYYAWRRVSQP